MTHGSLVQIILENMDLPNNPCFGKTSCKLNQQLSYVQPAMEIWLIRVKFSLGFLVVSLSLVCACLCLN